MGSGWSQVVAAARAANRLASRLASGYTTRGYRLTLPMVNARFLRRGSATADGFVVAPAAGLPPLRSPGRVLEAGRSALPLPDASRFRERLSLSGSSTRRSSTSLTSKSLRALMEPARLGPTERSGREWTGRSEVIETDRVPVGHFRDDEDCGLWTSPAARERAKGLFA